MVLEGGSSVAAVGGRALRGKGHRDGQRQGGEARGGGPCVPAAHDPFLAAGQRATQRRMTSPAPVTPDSGSEIARSLRGKRPLREADLNGAAGPAGASAGGGRRCGIDPLAAREYAMPRTHAVAGSFRDMTMRIKMYLLTALVIGGVLCLCGLFVIALQQVRVNGALYQRIAKSSRLVTTVASPSLYVVESYVLMPRAAQEQNEDCRAAMVEQLREQARDSRCGAGSGGSAAG